MDHQALKDIRMALLDGIAMMKQQIEQQNPSKDARKAYDNSFKYLERCSSKLEKLAKKNERQVPSSIMRKFIYKSGRTQSAQGRETCP